MTLESGDDDDSAAGEAVGTVQGELRFRFWENLAAQVLACEQRIAFAGSVTFAPDVLAPDCSACTGNLSIDAATLSDVSTTRPDGCSEQMLADLGQDPGAILTGKEGGRAVLEMPLLDVEAAVALGFDPTDGAGDQLVGTRTSLAGAGLELTHIGFVLYEGTLFGEDGLDLEGVGANAPGGATGLGAFWYVFKDPEANPTQGPVMEGEYFMGSFWQLGL